MTQYSPNPIIVELNGERLTFASVDEIAKYADRLKAMARQEWDKRSQGAPVEEALTLVAGLTDAIVKVTAAAIARIDDEQAQADAALAEVDRLFGELMGSDL